MLALAGLPMCTTLPHQIAVVSDRMTEEGPDGLLCTYASFDSVEVDTPRELEDFWQGPESYFLVPGANHCKGP